jgi:N-acetylmuramoyl-L-alanine amidase
MSRQSLLVAGLISQLTTIIVTTSSVSAQAAFETNKVVSCLEDPASHSLTIVTARRMPLPAPLVSYLPGDEGETIMVVDFQGLTWNLPTRILRSEQFEPRFRGIQEVRVGRFQESPPICRISIVARDPRAFKAVAFKATSGALTVKWSGTQPRHQAETAASNSGGRLGRTEALPRYTSPTASDYIGSQQNSQNDNQNWSSADLAGKVPVSTNSQKPGTTSNAPGPSPASWRSNKNLAKDFQIPLAPPIKKQTSPDSSAISQSLITQSAATQTATTKTTTSQSARTHSATTQITTAQTAITQTATDHTAATENTIDQNASKPNDDETLPAADPKFNELPPVTVNAEPESLGDGQAMEAVRLTVKAAHPLAYSTFRLHNPERYVIDFSNCPELANAMLPDVSGSAFVRSVRVGQPEDEEKTRLVLDLIDEQVTIKERMGGDSDWFSVRLSRQAKEPAIETANLHMPPGTVIVLDAGHGGSDPGAQRGDVQEKEITMGIVAKLKRMLEERGARVVLTRGDDSFVSLEDRVRITNGLNPTLFLSVHINAMESANDIHGIETYYQTEQSKSLADAIHERLIAGLEAPDRAIRKARFYVIKNTPVPAVLAEVGFISNKEERDKLISSDYQAKVGEALEQGVMLYLDRRLALTAPARISKPNDTPVPPKNSISSVGTNKGTSKSKNARIAHNQHDSEDETR